MRQKRSNIILITMDSLRADHLGCYGYSKSTSPNLDRFAEDSRLFTHAFSNGPNTPHAFPAIMAARSALMSTKSGLSAAPMTLAEVLKSSGFVTVGMNAANPYVSKYFHYHRGFEVFHDYMSFAVATQEIEHEPQNSVEPQTTSVSEVKVSNRISIPELDLNQYLVSEENIHRKACLENQINADIFGYLKDMATERFFLWIHYMDTHFPYLPQLKSQIELGIQPISREENFHLNTRVRENMELSPDLLQRVEELYDSVIRQVDAKIGELLAYLQQLGLYDSTNIIITADHGEEFLEHGDLQHKSKLFDELLRVPLIIKLSNNRSGEIKNQLVSLIQLAPTILSILDIENPFVHPSLFNSVDVKLSVDACRVFAEASYGNNATAPVDRQLYNIELLPKIYCCRNEQWKLIMDKGANRNLLFNLVSDPNEKVNMYGDGSKQVLTMKHQLEKHIAFLERNRLSSRISRLRTKIPTNPNRHHVLSPSY